MYYVFHNFILPGYEFTFLFYIYLYLCLCVHPLSLIVCVSKDFRGRCWIFGADVTNVAGNQT